MEQSSDQGSVGDWLASCSFSDSAATVSVSGRLAVFCPSKHPVSHDWFRKEKKKLISPFALHCGPETWASFAKCFDGNQCCLCLLPSLPLCALMKWSMSRNERTVADAQALNGAQTAPGKASFIKSDSGLFRGKSVLMWLQTDENTHGWTAGLSDKWS